MLWRFSWCTLVALLLLLFVTADALRGQSTQIEAQKAHNATSRGISRFNARTIDQTTEDSASPSSTTKSNRERNFQSRKSDIKPVHEEISETNTLRTKPRLSRTTERSATLKHSKFEPTNIEAGSNPRGRSTSRASADAAKAEPTISRRSDRRSATSDDDDLKKVKNSRDAPVKDRNASRRTASRGETEKLDSPGPSVFTGAPDRSSFRTGRKIQTSFNPRELRKQVPPSKRFENETGENVESTTIGRKRGEGRNASSTKRVEKNKARSNRSRANVKEIDNSLNRKGHDLFSESESVRVDIPFTTTTLPSLTTLPTSTEGIDRSRQTSRVSNRRSDLNETPRATSNDATTRNRGRGGDSESSSTNSRGSRRGSSRFTDASTTETTEQTIVTKSRNANVRDRSRSEGRSRSRASQDTGNTPTGQEGRRRSSDRNSSDRRSRIVDAKSKASEQDTRRTRGKARLETSTTALPAVITTSTSPATIPSETVTVSSTEAELMITTINSIPITTTTTTARPSTTASTTSEATTRGRGRGRANSHGRTGPKEDFFNHGLGFRGRKVSPEGTSGTAKEPKRTHAQRNDTQHRGNPGWTLRRRPGHSSKPETTTQATTPLKEQTNEIIPPSEQITSTEVITKIETSTSTLRRGSKKLKTNEDNLTPIETSTKTPRRGQKIFDKSGSSKTTAESAENDNYPPEFIAKLSQLKNNNTKPPPPKTTSKPPPEAKKSSATLFAERSRMKLDLARRLVKPALNVEENDLDTSTIPSFVKSKSDEVPINTAKIGDQQDVRTEAKRGFGDVGEATTKSTGKKGRIISERMVTSISVEEGKLTDVEEVTKAYMASTPAVTILSTEATTENIIASTRAKLFGGNSVERRRETSPAPLSRGSRYLERLSSTTPKPKKSYLQPRGSKSHSGERREKNLSEENSLKKAKSTKTTFRPRYNKKIKQKSTDDQNEIEYQATTTQRSTITSRYTRKKVDFKSAEEKSKLSTEAVSIERQTKRREYRPRTATYRRHSEVPTTLTEATTKAAVTGVAITPRSPRYHATLKTSTTPQPTVQEPQVSLQVSNDTVPRSEGITDSSNGNSGNTNIFSPTRSSLFLTGNNTLLEQIRSTVAPLLSSLGNKSPIFAGAYSNVNSRNSAPRITPNGSPPRFSARYKGAELFVRKPSPYQATVPSVTSSSSTTPNSLLENSGAVPPIDVSSPGEPRFLTFYHAVESASIKDEQLQVGSRAGQPEQVAQVVSNATTTPNGSNGDLGNPNNDTTTPATASTTMSPQTQSDSSVITNQSDTTTLIPSTSGDAESASPPVTTEALSDSQNTPGPSTTIDTLIESTTQPSEPQDLQINPRIEGNSQADTSAVSSTAAQDSTSTVDSLITVTTTNAPTTIMDFGAEISSNDLTDDTSSTLQSTSTQSTDTTSTFSINLLDGTTPATVTTNPESTNSFESPESNAIGEEAEGSSTEGPRPTAMSSDAPTTETVSGSISDAPTTEVPITSTFRNRLIDFAQDILSRLQGAIGSTTVPTAGEFTTTVPPAPTEISNAIVDSRASTALESLSQLRGSETTTRMPASDPTELTTVQNSLAETTTVSSLNANQLDGRISSEDNTTQSSIESTQERNTQSGLNIDSTTVAPGGNGEDSSANGTGLGNSSSLPLDAEITTVSTQYTTLESDARTSNDTLLSELMTIAKTLFSEAMNETQQLLAVQSTTNNTGDLATVTLAAGVEAGGSSTLSGNEVDQAPVTTEITPITEATTLVSSTSAEQVDTTESSIDTSSENVDISTETSTENVQSSTETSSQSTEDSIETSSESVGNSIEASLENLDASLESLTESVENSTETSLTNESTTSVDISENEVESIMDSTTQSNTLSSELVTTVESRLGEGSADLSQSNENATVDVEIPGMTTQSGTILPEVESEVESNQLPSTTTLANTETDTTATTPMINSTESSVKTTAFELTTNMFDLQSRNYTTVPPTETQTTPTRQTTESIAVQTTELIDGREQTQSVNNVNESTTMSVTPEPMTEAPVLTSTNLSPEVTMPPVVTIPESILSRVNTTTVPSPSSPEMTTGASVNTITETEVATTETIQESTVAVTTEASTRIIANVTNDTDTTTNQTIEPVTGVAPDSLSSDVGTRQDSPPENTTPIITTVSPSMSMGNANSVEATETTTNQHSLTIATEPTVDVVSNPAATTTEATNMLDATTTTTSFPQTTPNLENETPTVVARFQDATSATAQGTAGSANAPTEQPTDTSIPTTSQPLFVPETPESSTLPTSQPPLFEPSSQSPVEPMTTTGPTTMTETTTMTASLEERVSTTESSGMDVFTVTAVPVSTAPTETTLANTDENLVSTEASASITTTPAAATGSVDNSTIASTIDMGDGSMSTPPPDNMTTTTAASMPETNTTMPVMMSSTTTPSPMAQPPTTPPYLGRFGGNRMTPAPRFSPSSTTKAPLRDYLIYGIYPNKTIVRKRPEDNLIDARNVDSPYVIFGIYPDGRLVRKFPNGTIIPDPPRSPVEVVFTLSTTTTTNRPLSRPYYNQANQGTYSQYQAPGYYSNPSPAADPMRNVPSPGNVDLGLTGNAIVGPNGGGPDSPGPLGSPASTGKMSDVLLKTGGGLSGNIASAIAGLLTPITSSGGPMRAATDSQGGRIVVDRERDEATRTKEAGGQRSSVYIGQDKFVNYWTNARPDSNPRVLSVNINSVASATNEGPSSSSPLVPSFENLLNNEPGGQVTAPPGFPWRDPLDQILGITTNPPVITASVASNTLDDSSESNVPIAPRPVNPFVEVFAPISSTMAPPRLSSSTTTMPATPSSSTTTMAPTTTSSTTVPSTMAPVTSTPAPVQSSSLAGDTTTQAALPTATDSNGIATAGNPQQALPDLANRLLASMQKQNAFGTTFDDLAFLNSLLQAQNSESTTAQTLTEVEQLLANKILSLALNNPGPTRSPKAIEFAGASSNSFGEDKPRKTEASGPIVIDLFPSSTASSPTWKAQVTQPASQKLAESTLAPDRVTWKPVPSSSTASTKRDTVSAVSQTPASIRASTTTARAPVVITSKPATTPKPRTTTSAPFSFGAGLWQALFGGNFFGQQQGARPTKQNIKQPTTTPRPVQITPKPVPTTQWPTKSPIVTTSTERVVSTTPTPSTSTPQRIDISKIHVVTPNSISSSGKGVAAAASSISTTQQPFLNNPNPRLNEAPVSSTFSPEEDAKFLSSLLRALQNTDNKGTSSKSAPQLSENDELFLRAILSGQTTTTSTTPSTELNNAALLAALLKAQGIEPPMPVADLREQLLLASLGQSVTSAPSGNPTTTSTTRPSSATGRPTASTTKKSATPRPTSRPRPRTTTWLPSSTYPPPLFSSFSNYGTRGQSTSNSDSGNNGLFGATRSFSQFLGAAISGAAQQLQSFVRNGTRIVTEVVG